MKVWLVKSGEPVAAGGPRMRTGMLASALRRRGHEVTWWTSTFEYGPKVHVFDADTETTLDDGTHLRALHVPGYKGNRSPQRYLHHRLLAYRFARAVRDEKPPDVIVAAMPDQNLCYEAALFAERHQVPLVVDVRDAWPEVQANLLPRGLRRAGRLALRGDFQRLDRSLRIARSVTSMVDDLLLWALKRVERERGPLDDVFFIGAPPWLGVDAPAAWPELDAFLASRSRGLVVSYIGGFNRDADPSAFAHAAARFREDEGVAFVLAGDGPFAGKAREILAGRSHVFMPGWIDAPRMRAILERSDIGVVPSTNGVAAFPNKAFTYLACGVPLLSWAGGQLEALIREEGFGLQCPAADAGAIAARIRDLAGDRSAVDVLKERARIAYERHYRSDRIYDSFARHIERVAAYADTTNTAATGVATMPGSSF